MATLEEFELACPDCVGPGLYAIQDGHRRGNEGLISCASQGGSSWRQQPGKQSKPATPLLVFSPGIGKRRKLGAATRSGLGGQKFPGRREWQGAAGSSLALGAARDMPRRACLPRKRGKQGAAGRVAEASRGGGNTSSRIF